LCRQSCFHNSIALYIPLVLSLGSGQIGSLLTIGLTQNNLNNFNFHGVISLDTNAFVCCTQNNLLITAKEKTVLPDEFSIIVCIQVRSDCSNIENAGIDLTFVRGNVFNNFAKILTPISRYGFNILGISTIGEQIFLGSR
jgi:hypothetical protein